MKLLTKNNKNTFFLVAFFVVLSVVAFVVAIILNNIGSFAVLSPKGTIAQEQKELLAFASILSLTIIVPVFALTFWIVWKYRAGNKKSKYRPDFNNSRVLEGLWWGVPLILITILSVITWKSSHALDPFKPLESDVKPVKIQVVSMNWKWLFIYPEENIATVNYVKFPVDTPVNFEITGDSAMNSFWIPELAGQIYAMPGMSTQLHIEASQICECRGSSANISGQGFADMNFVASAQSEDEYKAWVKKVQKSPRRLGVIQYKQLAQPSRNHHVELYGSVREGIYNDVIRKYIEP
jgi:cytochrome o ubiquinol oxidase subunit II